METSQRKHTTNRNPRHETNTSDTHAPGYHPLTDCIELAPCRTSYLGEGIDREKQVQNKKKLEIFYLWA